MSYSVQRGEIYYIASVDSVGSEMTKSRPGLIVSNDVCNQRSPVVQVVFLTTQEKKPLETHVHFRGSKAQGTILCEQIHAVSVERIGDYCECVDGLTMQEVDNALALQLDINNSDNAELSKTRIEIKKLRAELGKHKEKVMAYEVLVPELERATKEKEEMRTIAAQANEQNVALKAQIDTLIQAMAVMAKNS